MSKVYKNSYSPPTVKIDNFHENTPEDEYDHNYVFEVKALKSERVELRPFIVSSKLFVVPLIYALTKISALAALQAFAARPSRCARVIGMAPYVIQDR